MARYKPQERNGLLLPVVLSEQIVPGSFAFALAYLVDHELDLTALDLRFKNDQTGASAFDPRVMLKIVLLAYSQGLISSRSIAAACSGVRSAPASGALASVVGSEAGVSVGSSPTGCSGTDAVASVASCSDNLTP